ncbi:NAD-dependent epimerase/dehydratase family protein [Pseudalkalibacillus hwajinpoensis]|uniref:NAD-dependent epimerase/dehydratase family protein n=1 Tax=Guptibacillus hwajinpoensis TaxID=208199 RepID=UPI00325A5828
MNTIIISGGAGFIGSHLALDLLQKKHKIICIDNLSSGNIENIIKLKQYENFSFLNYDITIEGIEKIIENKIDEIYHLASPASPKQYQLHPIDTINVNTNGTRNLLNLARKCKAKFLFASTSEVYGNPETHPQKEDYTGNVNTWGPRACYDEAKRLGEVYCYLFHSLYNLEVKVVRLFNTYSAGLSSDDGRVISNFVNQAINNLDITVYGDGKQTRAFCYIDDTIRGLKMIMEDPKTNGEIINIGHPKEHTIIEVAELVRELAKSSSEIIFKPLPIDDPIRRLPCIQKARSLIGWEPVIDLENGLIRTIQDYSRNNIGIVK